MDVDYDVIIIGAGIAGLTSAIYCSRLNLSTLIISKDVGGQLIYASTLENYPGFEKISGIELIKRLENQVRKYNVELLIDEVVKVRKENNMFKVKTHSGFELTSLALILAFGKTPRELGVPNEEKFKGRGISYCVICDAPLYKGKVVALVGSGRVAFHALLILTNYVNKCYWISLTSEERILETEEYNKIKEKIELFTNSKVIEVKGDFSVKSIVIRNLKTGSTKELKVDGVFVEMGHVMKTDIVKNLVKLNEKGEIIVDKLCRTSTEGVFAAGDITDIPFKQAVISAGQGAIAALSAYNYIARLKGKRELTRVWH